MLVPVDGCNAKGDVAGRTAAQEKDNVSLMASSEFVEKIAQRGIEVCGQKRHLSVVDTFLSI
jgi:hypothetical protein